MLLKRKDSGELTTQVYHAWIRLSYAAFTAASGVPRATRYTRSSHGTPKSRMAITDQEEREVTIAEKVVHTEYEEHESTP